MPSTRLVHHAGVVDERTQGAEARVELLKHGQHLRLVGHIGLQRNRLAARLPDLAHHGLGRLRVAGVVDRHRVALARRQQRRGRANAARCTRDQNKFGQIRLLQIMTIPVKNGGEANQCTVKPAARPRRTIQRIRRRS
jgi:hypothetical protein